MQKQETIIDASWIEPVHADVDPSARGGGTHQGQDGQLKEGERY